MLMCFAWLSGKENTQQCTNHTFHHLRQKPQSLNIYAFGLACPVYMSEAHPRFSSSNWFVFLFKINGPFEVERMEKI